MSPSKDSKSPTRIAVLLVPPVQFLDVSPVDLFDMLDPATLSAYQLSAPLANGGQPCTISYVAEAGAGEVVDISARAALRVTNGLLDKEVAPGSVDILYIPGPDPAAVPSEKVKTFIRDHVSAGVTLLTVCTGVYVAGHAGVLDGKRATGPRPLIPALKELFPMATWVDERWAKNEKLWCSGGITIGQDMVAAFIREKWPGPTAEAVLAMADVGENREQRYPVGQVRNNAWWVWQILRAWFKS